MLEEATNLALLPTEPDRQEELQGQFKLLQDSQLKQAEAETAHYQEESTVAGSCNRF